MLKIFCRIALAAFAALAGPAAAAGLAEPAGHPGRALCRRRAGRHDRAHHRGAVERNARPADGDRERRRRRRHDRHGRASPRPRPTATPLLLSGSAVLAQNPTFHKQSPYDPIADFAHVALFSDSARVLIARKDFPPNDFKEFIAYVKAHQNTLQYGSPGAGSRRAHLRDPARRRDGHQDHPRALSRRRPRHAGPARRPHRLHARADFDRHAADQGRHREGLCDARPRPRAGARGHSDRRRARRRRPRLRRLGLVLVPQGHAAGDRAAPRQGVERRHRHARRDRPLQGDRRRGHRRRTGGRRNT